MPGPVLGRALGGPQLASIGDPAEGAPAAPAAASDLVNATVQILMVATIGGQEQAYGWGSGTIITPGGLIHERLGDPWRRRSRRVEGPDAGS